MDELFWYECGYYNLVLYSNFNYIILSIYQYYMTVIERPPFLLIGPNVSSMRHFHGNSLVYQTHDEKAGHVSLYAFEHLMFDVDTIIT